MGGRCKTGSYPIPVDSLLLENVNGEFKVNKNMILPLDDGEWTVIDRFSDSVTHGIGVEGISFVQMEGKVPVKYFEIAQASYVITLTVSPTLKFLENDQSFKM